MDFKIVGGAVTQLVSDPITTINAAVVGNPELQAVSDEMIKFGEGHPDWLHRTCLKGHLTGSGFVVSPSTQSVLLIHHRKLGRWLQPGGHADGMSNLAEVAAKEVAEETGLVGLDLVWPAIDLDIHEIPERGEEPTHLHLDVRFLFVADGEVAPTGNHEVNDVEWVSIDDDRVRESDSFTAWSRAVKVAANLER